MNMGPFFSEPGRDGHRTEQRQQGVTGTREIVAGRQGRGGPGKKETRWVGRKPAACSCPISPQRKHCRPLSRGANGCKGRQRVAGSYGRYGLAAREEIGSKFVERLAARQASRPRGHEEDGRALNRIMFHARHNDLVVVGAPSAGTAAYPSIASVAVGCRLRKEWARCGLMHCSKCCRCAASGRRAPYS